MRVARAVAAAGANLAMLDKDEDPRDVRTRTGNSRDLGRETRRRSPRPPGADVTSSPLSPGLRPTLNRVARLPPISIRVCDDPPVTITPTSEPVVVPEPSVSGPRVVNCRRQRVLFASIRRRNTRSAWALRCCRRTLANGRTRQTPFARIRRYGTRLVRMCVYRRTSIYQVYYVCRRSCGTVTRPAIHFLVNQ